MRRAWRSLLVICAVALGGAATAADRVALVIGNAAYLHATPLRNPLNDMRAMEAALRAIGFDDVVTAENLDEDALEEALYNFEEKAAQADTALIFYSGHGMELGGRNYLIPIDARLARPGAERFEAVPLEDAMAAVSKAARLSVVIVDACRTGGPGATKSVGKGFVTMEAARAGVAIAFSTAPGDVAWDGDGELSPYTWALTEVMISAPDTDIRQLFTSLGPRTSALAGDTQRPFARFGDLPIEKVTLSGLVSAEEPPEMALFKHAVRQNSLALMQALLEAYPTSSLREAAEAWIASQLDHSERQREEEAQAAWNLVAASRDVAELQAFLDRHGASGLADEAQVALDALKADQREAQAHLATLGLFEGDPSAPWSEPSRAALQQFQREAGVEPVDGVLTLASLEALEQSATAAIDERRQREDEARRAAEATQADEQRRQEYADSARAAWERVRETRDVKDLEAFLAEYGDSAHVADAESAAASLVAEYRQAQELLKALGLYESVVDGEWGRGSRRALDRFLSKAGYATADGVLTLASLEALRVEAARRDAERRRLEEEAARAAAEQAQQDEEASRAEEERLRQLEPQAQAAWERLKDTRDLAALRRFLNDYAGTSVEDAAQSRKDALIGEFRAGQTELQRLRFYDGVIDGDWGPGSQGAMRAFQRQAGIAPADGELTPASLEALKQASTPEAPAAPSNDSPGVLSGDATSETLDNSIEGVWAGSVQRSAEGSRIRLEVRGDEFIAEFEIRTGKFNSHASEYLGSVRGGVSAEGKISMDSGIVPGMSWFRVGLSGVLPRVRLVLRGVMNTGLVAFNHTLSRE